MAHRLPPQIIDLLLLGAPERRRQLQDLPILGDVWSHIAEQPNSPPDLLVIPCWGHPTAEVAAMLRAPGEFHNRRKGTISVAFLDELVVATLSLQDIIDHVIPATVWWKRIEEDWQRGTPRDQASLASWIGAEIRNVLPRKPGSDDRKKDIAPDGPSQSIARLGALLGTFLAAEVQMKAMPEQEMPDWSKSGPDPSNIFAAVVEFLGAQRIATLGTDALSKVFDTYAEFKSNSYRGSIFLVTTNREAEYALAESVPAIKADAARSLFSINCSDLGWAVLDSGIDHLHPAFRDQKDAHKIISESGDRSADPDSLEYRDRIKHRIRAAFDFRQIRAILGVKESEVDELSSQLHGQTALTKRVFAKRLQNVIEDRAKGHPVNWRNVEEMVTLDLKKAAAPEVAHGTHVAGIIGADWQTRNAVTGNFEPKMQGVCPDIRLYDFRVLGSSLGDSEFAVSAALQFIRYFNEQLGYQRIHGVNMSLAIRHNVRNYACGRTPICKQAEALVANGVVVVAAAGNRGYIQYQLADQTVYEGYASSSITDPGNADGVITVGATHRSWPHTYGVSFFSSRGPTGDGRLKPDLLAPGERISSCVPGGRQDAMDGTSMAAPHVSGAAALLMARHDELKGNPQRIKEILCETATDLKRERHFQGHGMVDVLRAIQSI
jgi:subtilisin family serine protease